MRQHYLQGHQQRKAVFARFRYCEYCKHTRSPLCFHEGRRNLTQLFIQPLRRANPPIIRPSEVDDFIEEVFGNILDLRECNRRLLEVMYVRQREQAPVIHGIGDIFLDAATEFRLAYPNYVGHLPVAEKRMKDELEKNAEFRRFLEVCSDSVMLVRITFLYQSSGSNAPGIQTPIVLT